MPQHMYVMSEDNWMNGFSHFTMWVLGIDFRSPGLSSSDLTDLTQSHLPSPKTIDFHKIEVMVF